MDQVLWSLCTTNKLAALMWDSSWVTKSENGTGLGNAKTICCVGQWLCQSPSWIFFPSMYTDLKLAKPTHTCALRLMVIRTAFLNLRFNVLDVGKYTCQWLFSPVNTMYRPRNHSSEVNILLGIWCPGHFFCLDLKIKHSSGRRVSALRSASFERSRPRGWD